MLKLKVAAHPGTGIKRIAVKRRKNEERKKEGEDS